MRYENLTDKQKELINYVKVLNSAIPYLDEGQKVRINVSNMQQRPEYNTLDKHFKAFVESNKETIFTVMYDNLGTITSKNPLFVCLQEDPSPVKWLFWVKDLVPVED